MEKRVSINVFQVPNSLNSYCVLGLFCIICCLSNGISDCEEIFLENLRNMDQLSFYLKKNIKSDLFPSFNLIKN